MWMTTLEFPLCLLKPNQLEKLGIASLPVGDDRLGMSVPRPEEVRLIRVSLLACRKRNEQFRHMGRNRAIDRIAGLFLIHHDAPHAGFRVLLQSALFERDRVSNAQSRPSHHLRKRADSMA